MQVFHDVPNFIDLGTRNLKGCSKTRSHLQGASNKVCHPTKSVLLIRIELVVFFSIIGAPQLVAQPYNPLYQNMVYKSAFKTCF